MKEPVLYLLLNNFIKIFLLLYQFLPAELLLNRSVSLIYKYRFNAIYCVPVECKEDDLDRNLQEWLPRQKDLEHFSHIERDKIILILSERVQV